VVQVAVLEIITLALNHLVAQHKQTAVAELDTEILEDHVGATVTMVATELMLYLMKVAVVAVLDQLVAMEHLIELAAAAMAKHLISPVKWYIMQAVAEEAITEVNPLQTL
jgi:hypothetical protein